MNDQLNMFENDLTLKINTHDTFKFNQDTINLFEAFAGVGSQAMTLKDLAKEFKFKLNTIGISEIDKFAIQSYNAIHGETKNFGSIVDIEQLPPGIDIFTYSFPCQDISLAGKGKGLSRGKGTRSGLLWEVERLLKCSDKPKVLLMENVKALVNEKHKPDFIEWILELEELGYSNYWKVLNAKDYGIPQNRQRVFMVSILGEWNYDFPKGFPLKLRLKDMLEDEVDKKYYLSDKMLNFFQENSKKQQAAGNGFKFDPKDGTGIAKAITTNAGSRMDDNFLFTPSDVGVVVKEKNLTIRKLTPKECWRLMGFNDQDFAKAESICSNSQLYKQAGNSIVKDVLYYIFKNLF